MTQLVIFSKVLLIAEGECFIVRKDEDNGLYSSYTDKTSSTGSSDIRIRYTINFNGVGNAAPLYIIVYGLSED